MLWITLVLFIVGEAVAEELSVGVCPPVRTVPNFNVTGFMGTWYEVKRYNDIFEFAGKCVTVDFTLDKDGSVQIRNKQISSLTNNVTITDGIASPTGEPGSGEFAVTYPSLPIPPKIPYWIPGTNYDDWAVAWSCRDDGIFSYRYAWILARERKPSRSVLKKAYKVLKKNKISKQDFYRTRQKHCPKTY